MSRLGWSRPLGLGVTLGIACLASTVAVMAQSRPRPFDSPEAAFDHLHQVARSPRCVNCHGMYRGDGQRIPTVGDAMTPHPMNITDAHNPPAARSLGLTCSSCHGTANSSTPGGPPGAPEQPLWQMPTRDNTQLPPDISKRQLCENWAAAIRETVNEERRRGAPPRPASKVFVHHVGHDKLIEWAFSPGEGRTPAPGGFPRLVEAAEKWAETLEDPKWCATLKGGRRP